MRNNEYFWKDGAVVSHTFEGVEYKSPILKEHGLVNCFCVDTNCEANSWGRTGRYITVPHQPKEPDIAWRNGTVDELPNEFKTALLLLGVQP